MADARKYSFAHNGEDFVIWSWKGDYCNLGSGAETGIYRGDGTGHNFTATDMAMPMTLSLKNTSTDQVIFDYAPQENQWWITGFDPRGQGTSYTALEATTTIDFSGNPGMYESFYIKYRESEDWEFDAQSKKATLTW